MKNGGTKKRPSPHRTKTAASVVPPTFAGRIPRTCAPGNGGGTGAPTRVQRACSQGNFASRPLGRLAAGDRRSLAKGTPCYFSCSSQISIYIIYTTFHGQIQGDFSHLRESCFLRNEAAFYTSAGPAVPKTARGTAKAAAVTTQ